MHIVSGTPGRVFDMIKRRSLRTRNIKVRRVTPHASRLLTEAIKRRHLQFSPAVAPSPYALALQLTCLPDIRNCLDNHKGHRIQSRFMHIQVLVLDEADEMLNKGFREQIYDIYRCVSGPDP